MSDVQQILFAIAKAIGDKTRCETDFVTLAEALYGVPEIYHADALKALLKIEEQPF